MADQKSIPFILVAIERTLKNIPEHHISRNEPGRFAVENLMVPTYDVEIVSWWCVSMLHKRYKSTWLRLSKRLRELVLDKDEWNIL